MMGVWGRDSPGSRESRQARFFAETGEQHLFLLLAPPGSVDLLIATTDILSFYAVFATDKSFPTWGLVGYTNTRIHASPVGQ